MLLAWPIQMVLGLATGRATGADLSRGCWSDRTPIVDYINSIQIKGYCIALLPVFTSAIGVDVSYIYTSKNRRSIDIIYQ